MRTPGMGERRLLSIVDADQLRSVLKFMLDEREFLRPTAFARCRSFTVTTPTAYGARQSTVSTTSRRNRRTGCSAGIPTGAGRSGFL